MAGLLEANGVPSLRAALCLDAGHGHKSGAQERMWTFALFPRASFPNVGRRSLFRAGFSETEGHAFPAVTAFGIFCSVMLQPKVCPTQRNRAGFLFSEEFNMQEAILESVCVFLLVSLDYIALPLIYRSSFPRRA